MMDVKELAELSWLLFMWPRGCVHEMAEWNFWCNWWSCYIILLLCAQWNVWPWPCKVPFSSQLSSPVKNPSIERENLNYTNRNTHIHTYYCQSLQVYIIFIFFIKFIDFERTFIDCVVLPMCLEFNHIKYLL
jgi:hypothetical protein